MKKITPRDFALGIIFISQIMIGILGNFFLLYYYLFLYHTQCRMRATVMILKHRTIVNSLIILSKGAPQTNTALGWKHIFSDFACKLILYVERVGRSMSIGTTCPLSVFQISPMNSCWKNLKVKAPKYIASHFLLLDSVHVCTSHFSSVCIICFWQMAQHKHDKYKRFRVLCCHRS